MYHRMLCLAWLGLILFCAGCGDLTPPDRKPVNPTGIVTDDLDDLAKPVRRRRRPAAPAKPAPPAARAPATPQDA